MPVVMATNTTNPERRWVIAILALYLLIGLTHSIVNPVFESSDEWSHYPFVENVAQGRGLPVQEPGKETLWRHEGSQPPLYYLMMGALTGWIDTSDLPQIMRANPHARIGIPLARDNKNMIVHTDAERWPWRGTVLAVHLVRIASVLMGAVTVLFTYLIARELAPDEPGVALLAMGLNATLPMFAFITGSVNNDNITYMISAVAFLLILRASRRPPIPRDLILLGIVLAVAALSKLSGLVLIPVAALAVAIGYLRNAERPFAFGRLGLRWLRDMAIVAVPVVGIAAWWYVRNIVLYGDPTGLKVLNTFIEGRDATPWWQVLLSEWQGFRINFWGLFGGVNVLMEPGWIYYILDGLTALAAIGLIAWVVIRLRTHRPARWVELGLAVVYLFGLTVGVARYTLSTPATQGRLIFPGMGVIMTFFALGLIGWAPRRWRPFIGAPVVGLLFALAISSPFTAIQKAYAGPPVIDAARIPPTMQPYGATFNGEITLLGFELGARSLTPGEELPVTLYWQAVKPPAEDYSLSLKLFGREGLVLGQEDVYPGRGTLPTSMWPAGKVIVDTFYVPVTKGEPSEPVAAEVQAVLYRYATREPLPAVDAQGQAAEGHILGRVKIGGRQRVTAPAHPLNAEFGQSARLAGYELTGEARPGGTLTVDLHWDATGTFDRDYTVFVHLRDGADQTMAQGDGPPVEGTYPTSFWAAGKS